MNDLASDCIWLSCRKTKSRLGCVACSSETVAGAYRLAVEDFGAAPPRNIHEVMEHAGMTPAVLWRTNSAYEARAAAA